MKKGLEKFYELVEAFESSIEVFRKGRKAFDDTTLLVAQLT